MIADVQITKEVQSAVAAVNRIVPKSYLVGGAVRDMLMGAEPKDYDFVTPLLPDEVESHIQAAGRHCWSGNKRFGTLAAKIWFNEQWNMVDITTFRNEVYAPGCRKPSVSYDVGDITSELGRHDFTCNAIAVKPDGTICDPFEGHVDIADNVLRAVGNATIRFKEDPLRMLRAYRFVSTKGFWIHPATLTSLEKHSHRILEVSRERWVQEMDKLLCGDYVNDALASMFYWQMFKWMIPELQLQFNYDQHSPYHDFSLDRHTARVVAALPKDPELRWAGLLHDIGKPFTQTFKKTGQANYIQHDVIGAELVEGIAHRLRWSKSRTKFVQDAVRTHITDPDNPLQEADRLEQKVGSR